QLSRPKGRGAHPHRVLSPVPKLDHRCVQQRAPLHRPARRPGGVRTAGGPPQWGRRADLLTALDGLDPQLLTRARGAVLGLVVGNQLGVPTERLGTAKAIREAFPQVVRVSAQQAAITHADERCTWGAVAVNLAARELLHGNRHFVEEVLHRLEGAAPRLLLEAIRRVPWEEQSDLPLAVHGEYGYVVH